MGEAVEPPAGAATRSGSLETNLDDISGELIGYCTTRLWEAGALDVYTTAIQMKKNRPGVKLSVLCRRRRRRARSRRSSSARRPRWACAAGRSRRHVLVRQPHTVADAVGTGRGQGGLAGRRPAAFRPRVRVVPPLGRRARTCRCGRSTKRPRRRSIRRRSIGSPTAAADGDARGMSCLPNPTWSKASCWRCWGW